MTVTLDPKTNQIAIAELTQEDIDGMTDEQLEEVESALAEADYYDDEDDQDEEPVTKAPAETRTSKALAMKVYKKVDRTGIDEPIGPRVAWNCVRNSTPIEEVRELALERLAPFRDYLKAAKANGEDHSFQQLRKDYAKETKQLALTGGTWPKRFRQHDPSSWASVAHIIATAVEGISDEENRTTGIHVQDRDPDNFLSVASRYWRLALEYPKKAGLNSKKVIVEAFSYQSGFWDKTVLEKKYSYNDDQAEGSPTCDAIIAFLKGHITDPEERDDVFGLLAQYHPGLRISLNVAEGDLPEFDTQGAYQRIAAKNRQAHYQELVDALGTNETRR